MKTLVALFIFAIAADGAYEGDFCNKDGVGGVCKYLEKCPAAQEDLKNRRPIQNCGFGGMDPIVCCVSSTTGTTSRPPSLTTVKSHRGGSTTEYVPPTYDYIDVGDKAGAGDLCEPVPPSLTVKKTGQKAWDKCIEYQDRLVFPCAKSPSLGGGWSRTNRCHHNADELIIGGTDAALNEFPHMVMLGYGDDPNNLQWLCGGTLISEKFVLTAGHCIASREGGDVTYIQAGVLRRAAMPTEHRHRVKRIIKHPQYNPPHKYHDIALLELETAVQLSDTIVPACVHTGAPVNDSRASVTGWGLTAYNGKTSDRLQKVILIKFPQSECAITYKPNRLMKNGLDDSTQICFGDRSESKDTCQGDSGGPLQIKHKQVACMYTVIGVTSFGQGCGFVGIPGIYTRVANYLSWIEGIVWP